MNSYQLSQAIGKKLNAKGLTLSVAESCTGGLISHTLTNISGSSDYFLGGLIAYSNMMKQRQLKVPESILKRYGAVSAETAVAMVQGVRKVLKSDIALATTGIAGPTGGSKAKPVGLVYLGLANQDHSLSFKKVFLGSRLQIKQQATQWALKKLHGFI